MSRIYEEYQRLKKINPNKLYMFKSGNFYIFIGDDLEKLKENLVLKETSFCKETNKWGFPLNAKDKWLNILNNLEYDVEVIEEIKTTSMDELFNFVDKINIDELTPVDGLIKLKEVKEMFEYVRRENK